MSAIRRLGPLGAVASLLAVALAAPSRSAPGDQPELDGEAIYQSNCAACHDGGMERAPARSTLAMMSVSAIHRALTFGAMAAQGRMLTEAQRVAIATHLSQQGAAFAGDEANGPPCTGEAARFSDATPAWHLWGIDHRNTHHIPAAVAGLTRDDIPALEVAWARAFPNALRVRSQPNFVGGALIAGSHDGSVFAIDEASGCVRWRFEADNEVRTGIVLGEAADGDVTAYFGDFVGNVYALDAKTGAVRWRIEPEAHPYATITAAPVLFEGRLYVAVSSTEAVAADDPAYECCTFRGSVVALDAATGEPLWHTYTIPEEPRPRGANSAGAVQFAPSGAPVWGSPSIDPARRQLYVGTGTNYSSPAEGHSDAILAMDLDTGAVAWVRQVNVGDAWNGACAHSEVNCPDENGPDADFGAATVFATTSEGRDLVLAGEKSGDLVALDPDSGEIVWHTQVGRGGMGGGIRFGMALVGDRLFVPTADSPNDRSYPGAPLPGLYAIDIRTGEQLWGMASEDQCEGRQGCRFGYTGAITALDGMVLAMGRDGWLRIHDTEDGTVIWRFATAREFEAVNGTARGGAFSGGAAPVVHDGAIYVSSGYGFGNDIPGNLLLKLAVPEGAER